MEDNLLKNRKLILISIFLVSLLAISAVSANEDVDNGLIDSDDSILQSAEVSDSAIGSDSILQSAEVSDSTIESDSIELEDKGNVLKSSDNASFELDDKNNIGSADSELEDDYLEPKEKNVLSMDENAWFYNYIVWYDGDDGDWVSLDFVDDLKNPENITIRLNSYDTPFDGVDLAVINDYDYSITKLTTDDNGTVVYNVPYEVDELSVFVGFWYDGDFVATYGNWESYTICAVNWGTWYRDPSKRTYDFYVSVSDMDTYESPIGAQVVFTSDSNQYVGTIDENERAIIPKVSYGTYDVKVIYDGYCILNLSDSSAIEFYDDHHTDPDSLGDERIDYMYVDSSGVVYLDLCYDGSLKVPDNSTYEPYGDDNPSGGGSGNQSGGTVANGTFTSLQSLFNRAAANSTISLTRDYVYDDGFDIKGIVINKDLTINGNAHTLDALGKSRIFYVNNSTVKFNNILFANGNATLGGAIYNGSAVNCLFINNTAQDGGAIYYGSALVCDFINNSASRNGGAIYSGGAVNCSFINNSANLGGAAIYDSLFAVNSTFVGNTLASSNPTGGSATTDVSVVSFNPITTYIPSPPSMTGSIGWGGAVLDFTRPVIYTDYNETFYLLTNFTLQQDGFNNYGNVQLTGRDLVFKSLYPYSGNYSMALIISGQIFTPTYVLGENDTYEAHFKLNGLSLGLHMVYAYVDFGYPEYYSYRIGGGYMDRVAYDRTAEIIFPILINKTVEISSSNLNKYYGGTGKYTVTLTDGGNPIANANLNVSLAGKTYPLKTNANGQASMDINLTPGTYEAVCTYDGVSQRSNIIVRSTINLQNLTGIYQNAKVNATFLNAAGSPLANTKVSFRVGSKTYSATTNANGLATANVDLAAGTYDVIAINPVNNEQKTSKLTISKAKSSISLSSTSNNDKVTLTASLSPSTASGNVTFNLNNKNYTAKISSGKASQTITGLNEGNYTANAYYSGDSNLNSSSASTKVVVKIVIPTKIIYKNMTTGPVAKSDGRIGNYFCVKLVDGSNNALTGLPIKIGFNGKIYDRTTDSNGEARLQINLANADIYTFAICYLGDDDHQASFEVAKIDVNKKYPKPNSANGNSNGVPAQETISNTKLKTYIQYSNMTTKSVLKSDGRVGDYFEVKLLDNNKKAMANVPIKIGFNGKIYDRTTDSNGGAKLQINLLKPTTYTFAIAYLGDSKYQASFEVAKIVVKAQSPKLTAPKKTFKANAKTKSVSATLISERGKPMASQSLKFTINGKTYTAKTNSNGVATVNISLNKKGTYSCTVKFAGVTGANAKTTKTTIKIS
ncbi:adhesin-like protein [Methanobrevibacter ruminantium M1]|uniref:Adhesin-like protein n=1 Tax=Methanobrevibacter ruminantium (strain ATCC 35063 / DSM 1093 / JCM 13430 / OCM 146 / M1) TaxID=634498 RepID=D3E489_METRM|nr:adhesin-like protein [Methanobrevibacter ruminantium M1]